VVSPLEKKTESIDAPQAEKRSGKLTGWWYGEVDNRHKGGVRFRRRFETNVKAEG
jgi:hypothetical protein